MIHISKYPTIAFILVTGSVGCNPLGASRNPKQYFKSIVMGHGLDPDNFNIEVIKNDNDGAAILFQPKDAKSSETEWCMFVFAPEKNNESEFSSWYGIVDYNQRPTTAQMIDDIKEQLKR